MLDWKILGGVFAALLLVSAVLVSSSKTSDFFSDLSRNINEWLKKSPFGGFFEIPVKSVNPVEFTFYPEQFELKPDNIVNITLGNTTIFNFKGVFNLNFKGNRLEMKETGSNLIIAQSGGFVIKELIIGKLSLSDMKFDVHSEKVNITVENSTVEIFDFIGNGMIEGNGIKLIGNVSKVKGDNWGIG
jgi:hypothetical protein